MAYATTTELYDMLPGVPVVAATTTLLSTLLDRATNIIDQFLGYSYASYGAVATAKDVRAVGGQYLELPAYKAGSITSVYEVYGKGLDSETTEAETEYDILDDGRLYDDLGWDGRWYRVTAIWGYGTVPDGVKQVCLELAVNLWRGRDRGMYSDAVGVDGSGAVAYQRALTNAQKMILQNARVAAFGVVVV